MISTEVFVIGAGATGLGVAWDAALRGYKTLLAEKGDLAHGTSGRYHGLLHSGARYVVRDPVSAVDCYRENLTLKRILPSAIEDTGGFFAAIESDPPDYVEPFLAGCAKAGIPAEEVIPAAALAAEPLLNPRLARVFRVPDAACDSFDAAHAVSGAVRAAGGEVLLRHRVVRLMVEAGRVSGAELESVLTGERLVVQADLVINCTGAWAGQIAALAGCEVRVTPGKGVMVAMNTRLVNTVVNRLKPPSDGDILVPVGTVSVIGTTDVVVDNPDQYAIEPDEVELLMAEGEKLIPRFREFRALRAWAGVRPLYQPSAPKGAEAHGHESRLVTRAHAVLDHAARDGVEGFVSVVGGKLTTFRHMAEEAVDLAGRKLGTERPCRTADTRIDPPGTPHHTLRDRLAASETYPRPELVCECELVTRAEVEAALRLSGSLVLNDLRRDLRVGMGPCQAGFCAYRAAGLLHQLKRSARPEETEGEITPADPAEPVPASLFASEPSVAATNSALLEFLQERWKGMRPVMWGANLRQLELDLNIYRNLFGAERLPTLRPPEAYPTEKTA
jgi:glycerol-3-phosphate dehydrogenase